MTAETKRYWLLELPWRPSDRRFALVRVPSTPSEHEVGKGFSSLEEAELRCAAKGIPWEDVDVSSVSGDRQRELPP